MSDRTPMQSNRRLKLLGTLCALTLLLGLGGFALPGKAPFVDARTTIDASPEELFPFLNSRDGQQQLWTRAWERLDLDGYPMSIVDLGGPDAGPGTKLGFYPGGRDATSVQALLNSLARGRGEIVESVPNRRVVIAIDFGVVRSLRTVTLEPLGQGRTAVSWSEPLIAGNPFGRYLLLFATAEAAKSFEQLLASLGDLATRNQRRPSSQ